MDNENLELEQEEFQPAEENVQQEQSGELEQLRSEVTELKLRLALITGGAAPEKLEEGVRMAGGLISAEGKQPEEAAAEILSEYPHIRLARRTVPKLSAESGGKGDGFAAIRSIFARK